MTRTLFANLEKAALRYEEWSEKRSPGHVAAMREFFAAVAAAYDELAAAEPDRIAVIDASQPPEAVLADALAALQ